MKTLARDKIANIIAILLYGRWNFVLSEKLCPNGLGADHYPCTYLESSYKWPT